MSYLRETRDYDKLQGKWLYAAFLVIVIAFGGIWAWNHDSDFTSSSIPVTGAATGGTPVVETHAPEPKVPSVQQTSSCSPSAQKPWGVAKIKGGSGGDGISVAVLDTGIATHSDLHISVCVDATSGIVVNGCGDENGRGTHSAGIVAANGAIKGVAPSAGLWAVKVCGADGSCPTDAVANGIRYAVNKGANIILMPFSMSYTQAVRDAITYGVNHNVLFVAAADDNGNIGWPASDANVIAVGAIDSTDKIAEWSARGANDQSQAWIVENGDIEFAAPGVAVESTWNDGCYRTLSSTSAAAAHVAGLAAKQWQGSAAATRSYLQYSARYNYRDIGQSGDDSDAGFGLPIATT